MTQCGVINAEKGKICMYWPSLHPATKELGHGGEG